MEVNKIYTEDCRETMSRMPDDFLDLTVTSPPYGDLRDYDGYTFDWDVFRDIAKELYRVTEPGGVVVWVVGDQTKNGSESGESFRQALFFKDVGFNLHDTMIYTRPNAPQSTSPRYESRFEYMFVFSKGKVKTFNPLKSRLLYVDNRKTKNFHRYKNGEFKRGTMNQDEQVKIGNVWHMPNTGGQNQSIAHEHTAIFPEKLANRHIHSWSNKGDLVYDPFMGSGTTAKMALLQQRNFIGSEISKKACDLAEKRIEPHRRKLFLF